MLKVCSRCKQSKDVSQFPRNTNSRDGYNWYCKACARQMGIKYRMPKSYKACHEKYNEQCAYCKSSQNLEVHHLHGKLQEGVDDLILVCRDCHLKICHNGCFHFRYFICCRCNHQWPSEQPHPRICPKCKSAYWDKSRIR